MDVFPPLHAVELEGRFVYVNPSFAEALGYSPHDLIGRLAIELVHPDERPAAADRARRLLATGDPEPAAEQRMLRADGSSMDVEVTALCVQQDGRRSALTILRDVTQHRDVTAHMMQMDRMLSVGLVAAGLGHEINNPLSVVAANVDLALRTAVGLESTLTGALSDRASPDFSAALIQLNAGLREVRESLADARQGAKRVQSIVRDLRAFSRPEVESHEPVQIEGVLQAAVALVRNEIRHRARLVKSFEPVPAVAGNEARLGQVFLNLLINAVHAIPVGEADKHEIRLAIRPSPGGVAVEVTDSGCGISAQHLPRIFEPFFTTKPIGEGTGIGLAICRNIVLSQGGTIDVDSQVGRGTTFRVTLPAARGQAKPRAHSSAMPLPPPSRLMRVLVVDDEPLIGRVVRRCLGSEHLVQWVGAGRQALDLLLGGKEAFDVVFLDVMMPEMTGIEVCEVLAQKKPELLARVVFLTGGAFTTEACEFLERIPNRQIGKPFEPREIRKTAEEVAGLTSD